MIPGFIINALTFPGMIAHEAVNELLLKSSGTKVTDSCYFRFSADAAEPNSYIEHELPNKYSTSLLVNIGPLLVNSALALLSALAIKINDDSPAKLVFMWLTLSFAMHAFPSFSEARMLMSKSAKSIKKNILAVLGLILSPLFFVIGILKIFWLDLLYGIMLVDVINTKVVSAFLLSLPSSVVRIFPFTLLILLLAVVIMNREKISRPAIIIFSIAVAAGCFWSI